MIKMMKVFHQSLRRQQSLCGSHRSDEFFSTLASQREITKVVGVHKSEEKRSY